MGSGKYEKKKNGKSGRKWMLGVLVLVACCTGCFIGVTWMEKNQLQQDGKSAGEQTVFQNPETFSWAEFEALDAAQQILFQRSFASDEAFTQWLTRMQPRIDETESQPPEYPWETDGTKQPEDYTWEEFCALDASTQIAFQYAFEKDEFQTWMDQFEQEGEPVLDKNSTQWEHDLDSYTWSAFQAMTPEQQIQFQNAFTDMDAFLRWKERVNPSDTEDVPELEGNPWEMDGAKAPAEYSWEDFLTLTASQQIAFQQAFPEEDGFLRWYEKALPEE